MHKHFLLQFDREQTLQHNTTEIGEKNIQWQANHYFPKEKGKQKSHKIASACLQNFSSITSNVTKKKLNIWLEELEHAQQEAVIQIRIY